MVRRALLFVAIAVVGIIAAPQASEISNDGNDMSQFLNMGESRIVGGDIAPENSVPWKVALSTGLLVRSLLCGGSIISTRHVLTAAHCIDAVYSRWTGLSSSLRGRYGTQRWNSGGAVVTFSGNVTHANYVSATIKNDIGVLITSSVFLTGDFVKVLPLSYDFLPGGTEVLVSGYGRIVAGGSISTQLKTVSLDTISEEECVLLRDWMVANHNIRNTPPIEYHIEICTFKEVGQGTCNGDSGSGMVRADTLEGVGLVSWGFPCAIGGPDMYARIGAFKDFIENALQRF